LDTDLSISTFGEDEEGELYLAHLSSSDGAVYRVAPLFAYTRFGEWDLILKEPQPPADSLFPTGVWHDARGMAYTAKGELDAARRESDGPCSG
jgi:hypothetical protein